MCVVLTRIRRRVKGIVVMSSEKRLLLLKESIGRNCD
jgi:hypothetical protein